MKDLDSNSISADGVVWMMKLNVTTKQRLYKEALALVSEGLTLKPDVKVFVNCLLWEKKCLGGREIAASRPDITVKYI